MIVSVEDGASKQPGLPGTSEGGAPGSLAAASEPRSWHSEMLLLRSRLGSMGRSISSSSPILSLSRTDTVLWGGVSVPPVTCTAGTPTLSRAHAHAQLSCPLGSTGQHGQVDQLQLANLVAQPHWNCPLWRCLCSPGDLHSQDTEPQQITCPRVVQLSAWQHWAAWAG